MEVKKTKKNAKFTTIAWIMAVILLAIVIIINIIASVFNFNIDLTKSKMYSLTQTTRDYLENLDKEVDFYFLFDMDTLRADSEASALVSMLDEYSEYDCINFHAIDPDTNPEIKDELNPDGYLNLSTGDIVIKCGEYTKRIQGSTMYSGVYDENGNETAELFNGENYVTGAIKSVVEGIMPSVYFLTGHGEKTIEEDYTQFRKNLRNYNYNAKELNLTTADEVPEDAAIIIIAAPQMDITDEEQEKIESFLDTGGNLSLLLSPNEADIDYTNIEEIMAEFCIGMDYNRVYETDSSKYVSGDRNQIMVNLVDVSESDDESITDLTSSLISQASAIVPYMPSSRSFYELQLQNRSDLTICPLIETYDTAVGQPYGGSDVDPDEISGILYLSAYSEDRIRNNAKLVVMGNAEFIDDENVSDDYVIIPVMLYLSTITWMYDSDLDMNIASKTQTNDYMVLKSKDDTNAMMIILNIAPVVVAASGIIIWAKRRYS